MRRISTAADCDDQLHGPSFPADERHRGSRADVVVHRHEARAGICARGPHDRRGAYATCHCICSPASEPGYYYWRDRDTGHLTRRSEWFVTKSPRVDVEGDSIDYMVSFALPRFCDQMLARSRKQLHYKGQPNWVAKLDTIVHELYHIDPQRPGIRRMERADGTYSANCHGDRFFADVVAMVNQYLDQPDPQVCDFLRHNFDDLTNSTVVWPAPPSVRFRPTRSDIRRCCNRSLRHRPT